MQTCIRKFNALHNTLYRLSKRNQVIYTETIQRWFAFTIKEINTTLRNKFQKDVTGNVIDWEFLQDGGEEIVRPTTLQIMNSGGKEAYKMFEVQGSFDILNPESVKAANKFTAEMVREVNGETKKGVRTYISQGIKDGKSMDKISRELRPIVGLTGRQTESVINFRERLSDKEKFPNLTAKDIDKRTDRYAAKTHRQRTQSIARTETARAQNIGYSKGMEDLGVKELEFSIFDDAETSSECRELDGNAYPPKEAATLIPVHPNCRCVMLPVINDKAIQASSPPKAVRADHVGGLLKKLGKETDPAEKRKIRRALRKLGHVGGSQRTAPARATVKPASTAKPLSSKNINLKGMDPVFKDQVEEELNFLASQYPKTKGKFRAGMGNNKVMRKLDGGDGDSMGIVTDLPKGKSQITFSSKWFGSKAKFDMEDVAKVLHKKKWWASKTPVDLSTHEFGHVLERTLPKATQRKLFDYWMLKMNKTAVKKQIGKYAAESSHELFAEAFVQFRTGRLSKEAAKVMRIAGIK